MSNKKIVFLPYKLHFRHLLFAIGNKMPLTVLLPPEKSLPQDTKLQGIKIQYKQFGAGFIKNLFRIDLRTQKYVAGLSKILDKLDMDVLITCEFYHWYTLQCIWYKKRHPELKLFVISETKLWPRNFIARLIKKIIFIYFRKNLKHIDGVLFYTVAAKDFFAKQAPEAKTYLLPAPTDAKLYSHIINRQYCPNGQLRLLMNARYSAYKRHKDIFSAVKILQQRGLPVKLTCISREEKRREEVESLAKVMGVNQVVQFLDPLKPDDMPDLYASHDVLVLPSYNEAIGMVVPEAMASGLPTITSDTVGANVYVEDNKTGFIFKTGDVTDLVEKLENCFDQALLENMGKAAQKHIEKNFTPEVVANRFDDLITLAD